MRKNERLASDLGRVREKTEGSGRGRNEEAEKECRAFAIDSGATPVFRAERASAVAFDSMAFASASTPNGLVAQIDTLLEGGLGNAAVRHGSALRGHNQRLMRRLRHHTVDPVAASYQRVAERHAVGDYEIPLYARRDVWPTPPANVNNFAGEQVPARCTDNLPADLKTKGPNGATMGPCFQLSTRRQNETQPVLPTLFVPGFPKCRKRVAPTPCRNTFAGFTALRPLSPPSWQGRNDLAL